MPTITIPGLDAFVAVARAGARAALDDAPADMQELAALIVSEFATNGIRWSRSGDGGNVNILIDHEPGTTSARIEVTDDGPLPAEALDDLDPDQHGRGLIIVGKLAKDWGHRSERGHGTYWAVLSWD